MPRHLLNWHALPPEHWDLMLENALRYRQSGRKWSQIARHKSLGMIFFNSSLRTRTSMELAAVELGAHVTTLDVGQGVWGFAWDKGRVMNGDEAEHIREAVAVLSRYYQALGVRLFASKTDYARDRDEVLLHTFAEASTVPVINLESAFSHPCQALADAAALSTHFDGNVQGRSFVLSWATHPRALPMAVPNSALLMAARMGMNVTVARPEGYALDPGIMDTARQYAATFGARITETDNLEDACEGAEVIYAKAWAGPLVYDDPKAEEAARLAHVDWRITPALMDRTNKGVFMHCLPVRRNVVVDDAVLDSPQALHLLQAEFRLHAQKAILQYLWDLRDPVPSNDSVGALHATS